MLFLVIQTVKESPELILFEKKSDGGLLLLAGDVWQSERDEVAQVLPRIEGLLERQKLDYQDLKNIIVVNGKGAFSAARIGITIANTLAFSLKAKLFEITLENDQLQQDLFKLIEEFLKTNPKEVKIAKAIYASEPMISASKKQKFV